MSASSNFERRNRLARGPLRLPREITAAQPVLRLFITYLGQPATLSALKVAASSWPLEPQTMLKRVTEAVSRLTSVDIGVLRSHDELCLLITRAPDLYVAVKCAREVSYRVIPVKATPSLEVAEVCLDVYHRWLEQLSRAK